jgi:hypothetical protein
LLFEAHEILDPPTPIRATVHMTKRWIRAFAVALTLLASPAFLQAQDGSAGVPVADGEAAPVQPIAFPHTIHAGVNQIDCQYCHFSAERSVDAGIPPVSTCYGCHQIIGGTDERQQAEIQKVRDYWTNQEPIPWIRIYKVADHVHFPHMRHIAAEIDCATCHGNVQEMTVIEEVNQPLAMGWCVSCHIERGVSRDCAVCHY